MDALVQAALLNALLAAPLALLAAGVARLGRPAVAHALWLLVLLKLLTPPLMSLPVAWPTAAEPPADVTPPPTLPELPVALDPVPEEDGAAHEVAAEAPAPEPEPQLPLLSAWSVAGVVWLTGSAVWFLLAAGRLCSFRRWLGHTTLAPPELQDRTRRLAAVLGLSRGPSVWTTLAPLSPMVWGFAGRPRLLLPARLWDRLDEAQRDALLVHELAHLRRGDHLVRWLELVALGLYWWHPVAWWARRGLREAEEQCCDLWVVWALPDAAPAYASALVEAAAFLSEGRAALPIGASGVGHVRCLKRRLAMILRARSPRSLSWAGLFVMVVLGVVLLPLGASWADKPPAEPSPTEPPKDGRPAEPPDDPRAAAAVALDRQRQRPAAPPPRAEEAEVGRQALEQVRDEVELLEAQLAAKRALVDAEKVAHVKARERQAMLQKAGDAGGVTMAALLAASKEVDLAAAQLRVREAELLEPEVRLKQARRRLQALEQAAKPKPKESVRRPAPATENDRLRELERKLDRLLREVESLRRDVPRKQSDRGGPASELPAINERNFNLPFQVDPKLVERLHELLLFASEDRGATWKQIAQAPPTESGFAFHAPRDGEYWFSILTVDRQRVREPQTPQGRPPQNKILVDTVRPQVRMEAYERGDALEVVWEVKEENPGSDPIKLTYGPLDEPTRGGTVVLSDDASKPPHAGKVMLRPDRAVPQLVRLAVKDRAGNVGVGEMQLPAKAKP